MANSPQTQVLIAGAGPVGLTAAVELVRRGIACRIVDPLVEPPQYAKAVGVQPRTLEVFEAMGVLDRILDAATPMRGQIVYLNGSRVGQMDMVPPADVPFGFIAIPQYATERVLREELAAYGVHVERGTRLTAFDQHFDGVTAALVADAGQEAVQASYLLGADGAHSVVRKSLGLSFEGGSFTEQYMLGDVELDWSMPAGYVIRSTHQTEGVTDDVLVCIPLPGNGRYRVSMLVPEELSGSPESSDGVEHGFEGQRVPELSHLQAVIDRLAPEPTTARNLRWASVFRISHRLVNSYGLGRVFVAGDAAHIHPPTGAQGMNTGIQDAHNLAWKVALAVAGDASEGLLDSYDAERRPVGEEVVGRTVRSAREGIGADSKDPDFVIRREAQLLIDYAGSPIVAAGAGRRAPDATGLTRAAVSGPLRLFPLLSRRDHTLLLYAASDTTAWQLENLERLAETAVRTAHGHMAVYLLAARDADVEATVLPLIRDGAGDFAKAYGARLRSAFVVRPDGYLGFASFDVGNDAMEQTLKHLRTVFA